MSNKKYQVYSDPERVDAVKSESGVTTDTGVFNYGLMMLEWALAEKQRGRVVTSFPADMVVKQIAVLQLPGLSLVTSI